MYDTTQFTEMNKANVAHANRFATIAAESAEKLMALNMATAKASIAQGVEGTQAISGIKDIDAFYALQNKLAQAGFQRAVEYTKSLYDIAVEAQSAAAAVADEAVAGYTKGVSAWVDKTSASAPAGSEAAISALKSSVAASSAVMDQLKKASKQVASLAEANVRAAAENAAKVAATATAGMAPKAR